MESSSSIFIGVVDSEEIVGSPHWTDNRIGGYPVFSPSCDFPDEICCRFCSQHAAFILQISCPVDFTTSDRILYIFACINPKCSAKEYFLYRALTDTVSSSGSKQSKTEKTNDNLFEDDWGTSNAEVVESDLSEALEQGLNLNGESKLPEKDKCLVFNSHFISVFEEPNKEWKMNKKEKETLENLAKACLEETAKDKVNGEDYEKQYSNAFKDDTVNYHFYKRLRRCPEQIIRYEWMGQPLLSTDAEPKPGYCADCGAPRTFELQLMPALISILFRARLNQAKAIDLDFETILAYTCANNCTRPGLTVHKEQLFIFKESCKALNPL